VVKRKENTVFPLPDTDLRKLNRIILKDDSGVPRFLFRKSPDTASGKPPSILTVDLFLDYI
jgi:hypothetical protein